MSFSIGGLVVKSIDFTNTWGVGPGSARIVGFGSAVVPDTPCAFNIGGVSFNGLVADCREREDEGRTVELGCVDNRVRLMWDTVYGLFNRIRVIEDDPQTPGVDRKRQYEHIFPDDWESQRITRTKAPLTAQQILAHLRTAPTVNFGWQFSTHENLAAPVYNLDANQGKKLGNVVQEICEACNVLPTLRGTSTLDFAVKGEGTAPLPSSLNSSHREKGLATGLETRMRIVGERNLYQILSVSLEPDWVAHYEQYWFEPFWIDHVKTVFNVTDPYEAAALAREITLREYCDRASVAFADSRLWNNISRMEMPVWAYIRQIVFKAYRVPLNFRLNGVSLDQIELNDGLLCDLFWSTEGAITYNNDSIYPESKAFCLVLGQAIDLADPMLIDGLTVERLAGLATTWTPNSRFDIDAENKIIIFDAATFQPGTGANALFVQANTIGDDETNKEELERIVVPNASATVSPASVKASLCFAAERYAKWFGSGVRQDARYISGLQKHQLVGNGGVVVREITYDANNNRADQVAQKIANAILTRQVHIPSGGFTRHGTAGMSLNGAIDRVTVSVNFGDGGEGEGISEQVEYSKERSPRTFESERELERRHRSKELFPGQKELKDDAANIRRLAKLKPAFRTPGSYSDPNEICTRLPGNSDGSTVKVALSVEGALAAGTPVFGKADGSGTLKVNDAGSFVGVLACANTPSTEGAIVPVVSQGVVPTRVKGPFAKGDSVGVTSGETFAKKDGERHIGTVEHDYTGTAVVVARVRLGGGGSASSDHPFKVLQRAKPNVEGVWQYGVKFLSQLYKTLKPNDRQHPISGLLSEGEPVDDAGWFDLSAGGYLWLAVQFDSGGDVVSASIKNSDSAEGDDAFNLTKFAWSGNSYCDDDGDEENPVHKYSRKLIAYTVAGESGDPELHQVMFRHQVLRNCNIDGRPSRYPFDHEGGYPFI